nr:ABC transporter permease [Bacteroidota bacterium]
ETDTQQFMLPVTLPLIFAFIVAQLTIQNPEGPAATWFSIIPFTSPVVMMVRVASVPFDTLKWELFASMLLLIIGFLGTTWLAGKIYRTGILMYGKKITYKELGKWIFYKG